MQKEAVQLSDAWACLVNAATSRVFDVDRHATPLASELLRHLCRRFNDQYVPRSNDELLQRHMQMTGLLAIVRAISQADTIGQMTLDATALWHDVRMLSEMPLPATGAEFIELNAAIMAFYSNLNMSACGDHQHIARNISHRGNGVRHQPHSVQR